MVLSLLSLLIRALLAFAGDPEDAQHFGTVVLTGAPPTSDWRSVFTVRVESADPDAPPVLGDYLVEGDSVRFRPRFAFAAGLTYRARFGESVLLFTMPERDPGARPRVTAIDPSSTEVPSNLLRIYVHFSHPMRPKDVSKRIHLFDAARREVPLPFVEVETGLWDSESKRLTVFFHPGRVKRGVGPNLALGPPLSPGGVYRLVVDREMKDERGYELEAAFEREIRAGVADRTSPDPSRWTLRVRDRSSPLEVALDEPLDRALLLRLVRVESASGGEVPGVSSVSVDATSFVFTPDAPWPAGSYRLLVGSEIEDLAGNKPARLFDEAAGRFSQTLEEIELAFEVR